MVTGLHFTLMDLHTKASSKMINKMVKVFINGYKVMSIEAPLRMA